MFVIIQLLLLSEQSWEALPPDTATFTPDITPLILAAHRDNYEIIKILLDRGANLPAPHDVRSIFGLPLINTPYKKHMRRYPLHDF